MTAPGMVAVVEDSDADFDALCRALRGTSVSERVVRFETGEAALDFLARAADGDNWPAVMLLDLNLPGSRGLDVLQAIRTDHTMRVLPIVVVSGSTRQEDIDAAYEHGANAYIVKPLDYASLQRSMAALERFLDVIALPSPPGSAFVPAPGIL